MDASRISVWLVALGSVGSAVSYLSNPPRGDGLRFWVPLSARARLTFGVGAASVVLFLIAAAMALVPDSTDLRIATWLVIVGTFALVLGVVYAASVERLYRDRQQVLEHHASADWQLELAAKTARLSWCLRHPLSEGDFWPGQARATSEETRSDA